MLRNCQKCDAEFRTFQCHLDKGWGRFCSRKCSNVWQSEQPGFKERLMLATIKSTENPYWRGRERPEMMGENNPKWKGGKYKSRGRLVVLQEDGSYIREHRKVTQDILGRSLKKEEVVHHIDEDKTNNSHENLFLFRHQAAHIRWHHFLWRHGLSGALLKSNLYENFFTA